MDQSQLKAALRLQLLSRLERAIYELYTVCEYEAGDDPSSKLCEKVLSELQRGVEDFKELSARVQLLMQPGSTGTAIAWQVRRLSQYRAPHKSAARHMVKVMLERMEAEAAGGVHDEPGSGDATLHSVSVEDSGETAFSCGASSSADGRPLRATVMPVALSITQYHGDVSPALPATAPTDVTGGGAAEPSLPVGPTPTMARPAAAAAIPSAAAPSSVSSRSAGGSARTAPAATTAAASSASGRPRVSVAAPATLLGDASSSSLLLLARLDRGMQWGDIMLDEDGFAAALAESAAGAPPSITSSALGENAAAAGAGTEGDSDAGHARSASAFSHASPPFLPRRGSVDQGGGPSSSSAHRILQEKLASPDRARASPEETAARAAQRQAAAEASRARLEGERTKRVAEAQSRVHEATSKRETAVRARSASLRERLVAAESRHEATISAVRAKASDEATKVAEISWLTAHEREGLKHSLRERQHAAEARKEQALRGVRARAGEAVTRVTEVRAHRVERDTVEADAKLDAMEKRVEEGRQRRQEHLKAVTEAAALLSGPAAAALARKRESGLSYRSMLTGASDPVPPPPPALPLPDARTATAAVGAGGGGAPQQRGRKGGASGAISFPSSQLTPQHQQQQGQQLEPTGRVVTFRPIANRPERQGAAAAVAPAFSSAPRAGTALASERRGAGLQPAAVAAKARPVTAQQPVQVQPLLPTSSHWGGIRVPAAAAHSKSQLAVAAQPPVASGLPQGPASVAATAPPVREGCVDSAAAVSAAAAVIAPVQPPIVQTRANGENAPNGHLGSSLVSVDVPAATAAPASAEQQQQQQPLLQVVRPASSEPRRLGGSSRNSADAEDRTPSLVAGEQPAAVLRLRASPGPEPMGRPSPGGDSGRRSASPSVGAYRWGASVAASGGLVGGPASSAVAASSSEPMAVAADRGAVAAPGLGAPTSSLLGADAACTAEDATALHLPFKAGQRSELRHPDAAPSALRVGTSHGPTTQVGVTFAPASDHPSQQPPPQPASVPAGGRRRSSTGSAQGFLSAFSAAAAAPHSQPQKGSRSPPSTPARGSPPATPVRGDRTRAATAGAAAGARLLAAASAHVPEALSAAASKARRKKLRKIRGLAASLQCSAEAALWGAASRAPQQLRAPGSSFASICSGVARVGLVAGTDTNAARALVEGPQGNPGAAVGAASAAAAVTHDREFVPSEAEQLAVAALRGALTGGDAQAAVPHSTPQGQQGGSSGGKAGGRSKDGLQSRSTASSRAKSSAASKEAPEQPQQLRPVLQVVDGSGGDGGVHRSSFACEPLLQAVALQGMAWSLLRSTHGGAEFAAVPAAAPNNKGVTTLVLTSSSKGLRGGQGEAARNGAVTTASVQALLRFRGDPAPPGRADGVLGSVLATLPPVPATREHVAALASDAAALEGLHRCLTRESVLRAEECVCNASLALALVGCVPQGREALLMRGVGLSAIDALVPLMLSVAARMGSGTVAATAGAGAPLRPHSSSGQAPSQARGSAGPSAAPRSESDALVSLCGLLWSVLEVQGSEDVGGSPSELLRQMVASYAVSAGVVPASAALLCSFARAAPSVRAQHHSVADALLVLVTALVGSLQAIAALPQAAADVPARDDNAAKGDVVPNVEAIAGITAAPPTAQEATTAAAAALPVEATAQARSSLQALLLELEESALFDAFGFILSLVLGDAASSGAPQAPGHRRPSSGAPQAPGGFGDVAPSPHHHHVNAPMSPKRAEHGLLAAAALRSRWRDATGGGASGKGGDGPASTAVTSAMLPAQPVTTPAAAATPLELPPGILVTTLLALRMVNAVVRLDSSVVYRVLGTAAMRGQVLHALEGLLVQGGLGVAPTVAAAAAAGANASPSLDDSSRALAFAAQESLLAELLYLVGFLARDKGACQASLHWGTPPSLLQRLCRNVPFRYFSAPLHKAVLFPTLLAAAAGSPGNTRIIAAEINLGMLREFLLDAVGSGQQPRQGGGSSPSAAQLQLPAHLRLEARVPPTEWAALLISLGE